MAKGVRLDTLLVSEGFFPSRERAQAAILAGRVFLDGENQLKAGQNVRDKAGLEVRGEDPPYASRGGLKLAGAVQSFGLSFQDVVLVDVGASTGGFTDLALQNGARLVYAVDVGYGQLAWQLRQDPRVRVMERTNIRHLGPVRLDPQPDAFTVDVSFISLALVLPPLTDLVTREAWGVCLVKPQFEAGREKVGRGGVVRDPAVHREVIERVAGTAAALGFGVLGVAYSPLTGPAGNIEYWLHLRQHGSDRLEDGAVTGVVAAAHALLGRR
ncbi:MAG TPA: TlyA family RNA methyltransferase [Spirochaetia bacterium]|nr:TlyA family RNA methyltransferase [Spirochaetia bacterium]